MVEHGFSMAQNCGLCASNRHGRIENADNGLKTVSAIWDFGPSLSDGELAPGEMSAEKTLRFHLADLRPFDWCVASSVSHSSTRAFSALSENESFG